MFENGSFDRSLGCFKEIYPELEGIDLKSNPRSNFDKDGNEYFQIPTSAIQMPEDPHHEHVNVMNQLKDGNSGFVKDFSTVYPDSSKEVRQLIMSYYSRGFLPGLHPLAENFTICDHWFSSLPGPTWPNRFFALSGTSNGLVVMPAGATTTRMIFEESQPTIFSRLSEAHKTWKIYYHDMPSSLVMHAQLTKESKSRYFEYNEFAKDCTLPESQFPEFTFIEPRYFGVDQNDDHPPHNVMKAQKLIADVYSSIRSNKDLWESTLLVITYDEHGGFFDHVVPPKAIPPRYPIGTDEYNFDQLGVRVPTLLVSPWVEKKVEATTFDHTSLLKYLKDKWSLGDLGERVNSASSIGIALRTEGSPRQDCISEIKFDLKLLETGDRQLEAKPSAHHLALDLALGIVQDEAGAEIVTDIAEFSRRGEMPTGRFKWSLIRLGLRIAIQYLSLWFHGKEAHRANNLKKLSAQIKKCKK